MVSQLDAGRRHSGPTADPDDTGSSENTHSRLSRPFAAVGVIAILAVAARISLRNLTDADGAGSLMAGFYELIGLGGQADAIRDRGLQPLAATSITLLWALVLGSVGIWALYWALNTLVDTLGSTWSERIRPYAYVGPAVVMLGFYLIYPLVATVYFSFTLDEGPSNFATLFSDPEVQRALINNLIWLVVATGGSVALGLVIAQLFDRVKREALAKTFVFLPLALSMVGASVIWRFMYIWRPDGQPQIGLINAVGTTLGAPPVSILQEVPVNTFALIAIMVWLQTGFAMVILSAAIKGVGSELLEAARIDGANEFQVFTKIIIPSIRGSIITVATTIAVAVLKVFDIVFVMTGGRFETEVMANRMFTQMFKFRNFGLASATAVVLFAMVIPVMVLNIRNFRRQELER